MSDPVTQAEIEDVLSSIRRLVSEDGRTTLRPQPVQEAPKTASRLVLTPALRVSDPDTKPASSDETSASETSASEGQICAATSWDATDADHGATSSQDSAPGDIVVGDVAQDTTAEVVSFSQDEVTGAQDSAANAQAPDDDTKGTEDSATERDSGETAEDQAGALAEDEESEAAPWQDPDATLFHAAAAVGDDDQASEDGEMADPDTTLTGVSGQDEAMVPEAVTGSRVSAVVQKIAELEAKVARSEGQWEPDGRSRDPYAGTNIETLEWKDHLEGEAGDTADVVADSVAGEGEDKTQDEEMTTSPSSDHGVGAEDMATDAVTDATMERLDELSAEDSYLDEDSLRDLVSEIVRSELQGALGERITRNVRKLVRREIHRALAAQDLT